MVCMFTHLEQSKTSLLTVHQMGLVRLTGSFEENETGQSSSSDSAYYIKQRAEKETLEAYCAKGILGLASVKPS